MRMLSVGAELLHVDRQTDGRTDRQHEASSRFSQFCETRPTKRNLQNESASWGCAEMFIGMNAIRVRNYAMLFFEVCHPRCVGSITKESLYIIQAV